MKFLVVFQILSNSVKRASKTYKVMKINSPKMYVSYFIIVFLRNHISTDLCKSKAVRLYENTVFILSKHHSIQKGAQKTRGS